MNDRETPSDSQEPARDRRKELEQILCELSPWLRKALHGRIPVRARPAYGTDDWMQSTLLSALSSADQFELRDEHSTKGWLLTIAWNKLRKRLDRRVTVSSMYWTLKYSDADKELPSHQVAAQELHQRVFFALQKLSSLDQELLWKRLVEAWQFSAIGEHHGWNEREARTRYHSALKRLVREVCLDEQDT
jgi:RNA polymerase sigma factor (sigma-70 family)